MKACEQLAPHLVPRTEAVAVCFTLIRSNFRWRQSGGKALRPQRLSSIRLLAVSYPSDDPLISPHALELLSMTCDISILHPAVQKALREFQLTCETLVCDPGLADTAQFCAHYNFAAHQAANAIIGASKTEPIKYACCLVLANTRLDVNKKLCQLLGVKRASFASAGQTLALTGMEIGGVTPVGLPEMPIFVDAAVMNSGGKVVIGGGNRSSKLLIEPGELLKIPHAQVIEGLAK